MKLLAGDVTCIGDGGEDYVDDLMAMVVTYCFHP